MKLKKVSDINITALINKKFNPKTVHAYEWFHNPFNSIVMVARTKSGKTNLIYRTLEATITKGTNVVIFCPSVNTDETYGKMISMLKSKGANVKVHEHFQENKTNHIDNLLDALQEEADVKHGQKGKGKESKMKDKRTLQEKMFGAYVDEEELQNGTGAQPKEKKKKKKKLAPETIMILDDLSSACRHKSVTRLLTKSRHYKMRVFTSLHSVCDIHPDALGQVENLLLFANISRNKIEEVAEKCGLTFKDDSRKRSILWEMYEIATSIPFSFFNINKKEMIFKQNFNQEIEL